MKVLMGCGSDDLRVHTDGNRQEQTNDAQHIVATAERTANRIRSLKYGDTFAVFDHSGDIRAMHSSVDGLYYDGTRFLSRLMLELDG